MAISFVGSDSGYEGNNTTGITLTLPAHLEDDFGIIYGRADEAGTVPVLSIGTATGWTLRRNENPTTGRDRVEYYWYKKFTSDAETDPVVNIDISEQHSASVHVFRGVDTTTPFDVTDVFNSDSNDATPVNSAITPVTANGCLVLFHGATHNDISVAGAPSTPSSLTLGEVLTPGSSFNQGQQFCAYKLDYGSASTITPTAWTHTASPALTAEWSVLTIALRPAAAGSGVEIVVPLGTFTLAGQVPAVATGASVAAPAGAFTLAGQIPSVSVSSTPKAALNTDWTQVVDTNFRVYFLVQAGKALPNITLQLQYNHEGGGWNNVDATSSVARPALSVHAADGADVPQRLGSGTYVSNNDGFDEVNGQVGGAALDFAGSDETNVALNLTLRGVDVLDLDEIQFRLVLADGTPFASYTQIPTVTASEGVGGGVNIAVPLGAFTLAGQVPAVAAGAAAAAPLGSFTLAGQVPAVAGGGGGVAPLGAFTLSGGVPAVGTGVAIITPAGAFTLTGFAPLTAFSVVIKSPKHFFTFLSLFPTLSIGYNALPPAGSFTLAGFIPEIYAVPIIDGAGPEATIVLLPENLTRSILAGSCSVELMPEQVTARVFGELIEIDELPENTTKKS